MHLLANIKGNSYLKPRRFSIIHVFRVKIFDSSHGFSANQKDVKIQLLTQAPPTFDNSIGRLSHLVPQKYVCRDLIIAFFLQLINYTGN